MNAVTCEGEEEVVLTVQQVGAMGGLEYQLGLKFRNWG